jgi:error-prone DNA polymerase
MTYAELQVTSNFTFLEGASHAEELAMRAAELGHAAIAITDRNSLAGIVRAHVVCKAQNIRLIVGCRLDLRDGNSLLCLPTDRAAYGRLCELLTLGKRRTIKGACELHYADLAAYSEGQVFIALAPQNANPQLEGFLTRLRRDFPRQSYLAISHRYQGDDAERLYDLHALADRIGLPLVATNDVLYHVPERRILQDVLTCIRHGCTIDAAGLRLLANAERHLKSATEMARLFHHHPDALENVGLIADLCRFSLDELRYEYPDEVVAPGETAQQTLERLTAEGVRWRYPKDRYPQGIPAGVQAQIDHELALIGQLGYAPYFLTVASIVKYAESKGILYQGRGSAANSAVCYCLGITAIDPIKSGLLFERFISTARNEPPDIDVDFEHERREEVIQHIYTKYGRNRAGLTATVICYRSRAAIRDVGKVMGLSTDTINALSKAIWGWSSAGVTETEIRQAGLDSTDRRLTVTINLARELIGFPRHLSQHVGGFVISRGPLSSLVPIENAAMEERTVIEWDKDDIEALGMMKVDVLGLGMLSCIRRAFQLLHEHYGPQYTLANLPQDDPEVYEMLSQADTIGVFQVESRAQMSMLPRLKPRIFYDLVIEVAIVRPGPIQGDMVHPYLRRRAGLEKWQCADDDPLKSVLEKTLGVPLFQEQAMRIAVEAAGFSASEADALRRSMATFKSTGKVSIFEPRFIDGMIKNGYSRDFAQRCFNQIKGFGNYGFPESHAASFALLVYISAWIKYYYPDIFAAALLNSQPMGFYAPAQIIGDAQKHGIEIRPIDINHSFWDNSLEPTGNRHALRLGFRQAKGLAQDDIDKLVTARGDGYRSIADLGRRAGLPNTVLTKLAEADAFRSLELDRRQALWAVMPLEEKPLPLFADADLPASDDRVDLPLMPVSQHVIEDYRAMSLSLKRHPVAFLRTKLSGRGIAETGELVAAPINKKIMVAGLVLVRQRPGSASGVVFVTLEDEHGVANLVVWPNIFEQYRGIVMGAKMIACRGRLQREGERPHQVIHIVAEQLYDLTPMLDDLHETATAPAKDLAGILARADEVVHPGTEHRGHKRGMPLHSRDFH